MIIMNIELDNLLLFRDFSLNLSYPKKPVHTTIEEEHLSGRPNFRYKKLVVLMGANATGKTALGKILMGIFNFISKKEAENIFRLIDDSHHPAFFSVDLAFSDHTLYRISAYIKARKNQNDAYSSDDLTVSVQHTKILKNDSYETCAARLVSPSLSEAAYDFYAQTLEEVPHLSWLFEDAFATNGRQRPIDPANTYIYASVLENTLQTLDPRILKVEVVPNVKNTYAILYPNNTVLIQDGIITSPDKLSSGTKDGVGIAQMITGMKLHAHDFYFCDEKFSHAHTDIEKTFLSVMIDLLKPDQQLFFTTHNLDILEMDLPLHSFAFLRRDDTSDHQVSSIFASELLKKNNVSLRNAVENDLFSTIPSTSAIFSLADQ